MVFKGALLPLKAQAFVFSHVQWYNTGTQQSKTKMLPGLDNELAFNANLSSLNVALDISVCKLWEF